MLVNIYTGRFHTFAIQNLCCLSRRDWVSMFPSTFVHVPTLSLMLFDFSLSFIMNKKGQSLVMVPLI